MKIYGIKNCDSVKKSLVFLKSNNIDFEFIDFRKIPLTLENLQEFINEVGLEQLINKRSTTYRNLKDDDKKNINTELILNNITLIKRPVIKHKNFIQIGFNQENLELLLNIKVCKKIRV